MGETYRRNRRGEVGMREVRVVAMVSSEVAR